jgi:acetolactate synthase small subunit
MCIVLSGQDGVVEQARRQLEDLVSFLPLLISALSFGFIFGYHQVPVWAVLDYTNTRCINRELALVKLSVLGPEYLEDQLQGGPTHKARTFERETTLVHNFESSASPHPDPHTPEAVAPSPNVLTPSDLLRRKSEYLSAIRTLADQFGARIVDVSENSVIVEMSGKTTRVNAFLSLVKPFGILESARTGECLVL